MFFDFREYAGIAAVVPVPEIVDDTIARTARQDRLPVKYLLRQAQPQRFGEDWR
jgi:hypothetical protein